MSAQITVYSTVSVTLDELIKELPRSEAAGEVQQLRARIAELEAKLTTLSAAVAELAEHRRTGTIVCSDLGDIALDHAIGAAGTPLMTDEATRKNHGQECVAITIERSPRCHWHDNCESSPRGQGIMKIVEEHDDRIVFECLHCGVRGYFPVGAPFGTFHSPVLEAAIEESKP